MIQKSWINLILGENVTDQIWKLYNDIFRPKSNM